LGNWRASLIRLRPPLTPRGAFLLAVSALALLAGILRVDLAALFWGSAFLLLCLYGIVAGRVLRLLVRRSARTSPDFLSVLLSPADLAAGEEGTASVRVVLPRAFLPGLTVLLSIPLSWHGRRVEVRAPLVPGTNSCRIPFRPAGRGAYECREALLELRDVLGLTLTRLPVPLDESLRVAPDLDPLSAPRSRSAEGGETVRAARHRRRSEELLETRKYVPGDDPRRMNWKLYAHMRELFIRVGEETPPPDSRLLFFLDTTANARVPAAAADAYLDGMVEACGAAALAAMQGGVATLLARSGCAECLSFGEEGAPDLRAALAGVWWTPPDGPAPQAGTPSLPGGPRTRAVVFSSPGSPALDGILASMAGRGWDPALVLKDLEAPDASGTSRRSLPSLLHGLLFLPPPEGRIRLRAAALRTALSFRAGLAAETARFRGPPWRLSDVRSV